MQIIKAKDATISKYIQHTITEFPINDKDINIAVSEIYGEHINCSSDKKGNARFSFNEVCKELVYVLDGQVKIIFHDKEVSFAKGDVFLIEVGEKYYWQGKFKILTACTPAWFSEQHQQID